MSNPNYVPQPGPMAGTPLPPPKKNHTGLIVLSVIGAVFLAFVGACGALVAVVGNATDATLREEVPIVVESAIADPAEDVATGPVDEVTEGAGEPAPETIEEAGTEDQSVGEIGETATYDDGLAVEVTKIKMVSGGEYDDTADDGKYLQVTVKFTNGTNKAFDPAETITVSYGADGDQAESSYGSGVDYGFESKIAPGRSKSATLGFVVSEKQARDLQIGVQPDWDHAESIFLGGIR